jgi:hypothetical protein
MVQATTTIASTPVIIRRRTAILHCLQKRLIEKKNDKINAFFHPYITERTDDDDDEVF